MLHSGRLPEPFAGAFNANRQADYRSYLQTLAMKLFEWQHNPRDKTDSLEADALNHMDSRVTELICST